MDRIMRAGKSFGFASAVAVAAVCVAATETSAQWTVAGLVSIQEKPDTKTSDLANTVIYLEPKSGISKATPATTRMAMNGSNFAPRVRVVTTGSTIEYPNQDPFTHNVFSTTPGALFDLGSYGSGKAKSNKFAKPGAFPIYCNVHEKMTAYVVVVNTPWFAQASNNGRWSLSKVPAGQYTMTVWHERATPVVTEIDVPVAGLASLATNLDASGYKQVAHVDKNGKDYKKRGVIY
ncbi:MAG: hypothetical protein O2973_13555 [Gemmatimonadetes bacterium]|nr:hypothetical protein [Gemmatimonadota bacterium]